jgi:hypothetical protein
VQIGPVLVGLDDVPEYVCLPLLLHAPAVVQIQLPIYDSPRLGIDRCSPPFADGIGAVSTVLRGVALRLSLEAVTILCGGEEPSGTPPLVAELGGALAG